MLRLRILKFTCRNVAEIKFKGEVCNLRKKVEKFANEITISSSKKIIEEIF